LPALQSILAARTIGVAVRAPAAAFRKPLLYRPPNPLVEANGPLLYSSLTIDGSTLKFEVRRGTLWGSKKPERAGASSAARSGGCGPGFGTARADRRSQDRSEGSRLGHM